MSITARRVGISPELIKACSSSLSGNNLQSDRPFFVKGALRLIYKRLLKSDIKPEVTVTGAVVARYWPTGGMEVEKDLMIYALKPCQAERPNGGEDLNPCLLNDELCRKSRF
jgi:hypothetical protein